MEANRETAPKTDIYRYTHESQEHSPLQSPYQSSSSNKKGEKQKSTKKQRNEQGEPSPKQRHYKPKKTGSPASNTLQRQSVNMPPVGLSGGPPELPFKGSSFSSRISPSRLTSQVVSALNPEENYATSKLHSALTGKLQPHPHLRESSQTQVSPVRVPSPSRYPSPGSINRSTPPMPVQYGSPLGIKVPPDYNPSSMRVSPGGRLSPRAHSHSHNLPTLSPNLPNLPSTSPDMSRNSPGPPKMSGPFIRPDHPILPYRYIGDPSTTLSSVKTSTPNLRITATDPESIPRIPIPSNFQNLVLAVEKEQDLIESSHQMDIPFSNKQFTTEHRLTEALLRQAAQDPSRLEKIYKRSVPQGHLPFSYARKTSPPSHMERTSPIPDRISPAPHPKKDFQRRATPPPPLHRVIPQPPPASIQHSQYSVRFDSDPPVDLSKMPPKHRAKRVDQQSTATSHSTALRGISLSKTLTQQASSLTTNPPNIKSQTSVITQSGAHHMQSGQPPAAFPVNIPTMVLHGHPLINLPKMPIEAHGGVIRIPEGKLDPKTQEILARSINLSGSLGESLASEVRKGLPHDSTVSHPALQVGSTYQINPFTFPKSGLKVSPIPNIPSFSAGTDELLGKTPTMSSYSRSRSDISYLRKYEDLKPKGIMPQLLPAETFSRIPDRKFGNYQEIEEESKKLKPWVGQFNMRLKNLANFPVSTSTYRSAYRSQSVAVQRAKACSITGAAKSLDLLRQTIQKSINKEIDNVVQKYVEKFFNLGIANIKENTGPTSVTEEHLNTVCRQILEEAKKMYTVETRNVSPVREFPDNISETGSNSGKRSWLKKNRLSDSDSEKGSDIGMPKRIKIHKKGKPFVSGRTTPSKIKAIDLVRRDGPKWDPDRLSLDILLVMGARANKALGLGNTRGRLYIKHPDIFKYSGDPEDKQWLYEHHLMPATGGKAYMLLVEDIKDLAETDEYRDGNLLMNELTGFNVPEWMISKMKTQMHSMRTDRGKIQVHSRSATPSETSISSLKELDEDSSKILPFTGFSDSPITINIKTENETSSMDAEMEFLSGTDIGGSNMSPFNLTGGFDDTASPSPSDIDNLDEDPTYTTPFGLSKS